MPATPQRLSPLHHVHLHLGASMAERDGWQVPERYADPQREAALAAEAVALCDISLTTKIAVRGEQARAVLERLWPGRAPAPQQMTVADGAIFLLGLAPDESWVLAGPGQRAETLARLEQAALDVGGCAHALDVTSAHALVTVLGPRSVELLRTCSALDLRERSVPNLRCAQTSLARVHAVVARNDVGTLPAYALLFSRDYAEFVWEWLLEMGHEFGVQPIGISALEQLHRELAAPAGGSPMKMWQVFRHERMWTKRPLKNGYDVVIIGAGVHGLASAYYLTKHGVTDVAVLDMSYLGAGASGRNTAIIRSNYRTPEGVAFYDESVKLYEGLSRDLGYNVLFSQHGHLTLGHSDSAMIGLRVRAEVNQMEGVDSRVIDKYEVKRLVPEIDVTERPRYPIQGALLHPPGGIIRHDAVVWGYARGADRAGVSIHPFTEVTGITRQNGRVSGVETSRGAVKANWVVNTTAGWASTIAAMGGVTLPITTHPLQALVTEPLKPFLNKVIVSSNLHVYVSQTDRGELVIGAEIDPYTSYSSRSTLQFLESSARHVLELFPSFKEVRVLRQWAGICDMTPDYSPIIGEVPHVKGFVLDVGWGTYGFKAGPVSGKMVAELIATRSTPKLIEPFGLERFMTDTLVGEKAAAAVSH